MFPSRILLIEDHESLRDIVKRRLERRGYEVIVATNGAEGMAKARFKRPDLILMDLDLPILDGCEATRELKKDEATREIPILVLTARSDDGTRQAARRAGCDGYLTKPIDFEALVAAIAGFLGR